MYCDYVEPLAEYNPHYAPQLQNKKEAVMRFRRRRLVRFRTAARRLYRRRARRY